MIKAVFLDMDGTVISHKSGEGFGKHKRCYLSTAGAGN